MDKSWRRRKLPQLLILLLALGHVAATAVPAAAADSPAPLPARIWRVCVTDMAVPPYLNNDATRPGTAERLMVEAGRQVGLSVLLLRFPLKRCVALMDTGGADVSLAAPTAVNLERFQFPMRGTVLDDSKRLARVNLVWVRRAESLLDWNGQALSGAAPEKLLVATRLGMQAAIEPLQARGFKVDATSISTKQLLMKVALKRTDLAVGLQEEVEVALQEPDLGPLVVMPRAFYSGDFYAVAKPALPAATQDQLEAWWTAIGRLRAAEEKAR